MSTDQQAFSTQPPEFVAAVESMHRAQLRSELSLGTITPPQRLAPFSHAVGVEVVRPETQFVPVESEGDAFGRLILLFDPKDGEWDSPLRLVAYVQADMEADVASDPLLPEVAWEWLEEGLTTAGAAYSQLGGTVTTTASARFGDLKGAPLQYDVQLRASWTATEADLSAHVEGFANVLESLAGLPPEGVTSLLKR